MLVTREEFNNYRKSKGIIVKELDYFCYLLGERFRENIRTNFLV